MATLTLDPTAVKVFYGAPSGIAIRQFGIDITTGELYYTDAVTGAWTIAALADFLKLNPGASTQTVTTTSPNFIRFNGMTKFIDRPTTDAFNVQMKSEFTDPANLHAGLDLTVDWKAAATTNGGIRGVQGVARLAATFTMTAGSIVGTYGQFANNGTMNGAGILASALYGLIEDGGVFTAVGHLAPLWLDSHLTKTITAGRASMAYITNNGTTTFDEVFYIFGGAGGNGISALFTLDTASAMAPATPGTYSTADGYIVVNIGGSPFRIPYFAGVD